MSNKLTRALAALQKAKKEEGLVVMNPEQLTEYAQEQIMKSGQDEDGGKARIDALTDVVTNAVESFKSSPTGYTFTPFPDEVEDNGSVTKSLEAMQSKLDSVLAALAKQDEVDNEDNNPTEDSVHPPPVPRGHNDGTVATNNPQGDDNVEGGSTQNAEDSVAKSDDSKAEESSEASDEFVWPIDLNTEDFRKGVTKRDELSDKPVWGFDNEPVPTS